MLETQFPETLEASPELVAHHCTEAHLGPKALHYRHLAGRRASERSANVEAISHLKKGLDLLATLPETTERRRGELDLLLTLGPVLINTKGPRTIEVAQTYARALELCSSLPDSPQHFTAMWGAWRISERFETGLEIGQKLLTLADGLGDPGLSLQAHHCLWASLFHLGRHEECCEHVREGVRLYDAGNYRAHVAVYGGHDPKVCGAGERAFSLWLLGFPDQALAAGREAMVWARRLAHAGSLVHALDMSLLLHRYRRDAWTVQGRADELIQYSEAHGFPAYRVKGTVFQGWALAELGEPERGIEYMRQGLDELKAMVTGEDFPILREMLATACVKAGQPELALDMLDEAFAETEQMGLCYWTAELHRSRGEALLALSPPRVSEAEAEVRRALSVACQQKARALELRAAMSLAMLERVDEIDTLLHVGCWSPSMSGSGRVSTRSTYSRHARCLKSWLPPPHPGRPPSERGVVMDDPGVSLQSATGLSRSSTMPFEAPSARMGDGTGTSERAARLSRHRPVRPSSRIASGPTGRVAPADTLKRIGPLASQMGITRVANITGLDRIGVPVVMVCRPNSRSIAVSQGKGLDLAAAKASGLMEAVETFHAETITSSLKLGTYRELGRTHPLVDVAALPRTKTSPYTDDEPLLWIEGEDLISRSPRWVPYELVHTDYTLPRGPAHGCFLANTNGLASGNHMLEAISHGIHEVIERDASALWKHTPRKSRARARARDRRRRRVPLGARPVRAGRHRGEGVGHDLGCRDRVVQLPGARARRRFGRPGVRCGVPSRAKHRSASRADRGRPGSHHVHRRLPRRLPRVGLYAGAARATPARLSHADGWRHAGA